MRVLRLTLLTCCAVALWLATASAQDALDRLTAPWTGDLPRLLEAHRPIRVLVSYNRTNFFLERGVMRGLDADMMRAFEEHLAKDSRTGMVRLAFVPVPFGELIPALLDGRGDIVAAGLTVTDERKARVAFADPYRTGVREVVVGGFRTRVVLTPFDLSGREVMVMAGSSFVEHLAALNERLRAEGMEPVTVIEAAPGLVTEDLLEMAARGLIEYTVAGKYMADVWKQAMPGLRIFEDVTVFDGGELAWAVRPDSPELKARLDEFAATIREGTLLGNLFFKRYFQNDQFVAHSRDPLETVRLEPMAGLFRKYGEKYGFDWLKIAALARQESRFNMSLVSTQGAVGVMQILPSTARSPEVGIDDVTGLENNIHAGVKYLRVLCDNYFADVEPESKMDFALAAYNAGPSRIMKVRARARAMGLNPNRWFGQTEWAAYDLIGRETTAYVAHVQMYYAAYRATRSVLTERRQAQ